MAQLNPLMDAATFAEAARVQQPLIEDEFTKAHGLGAMSAERWTQLAGQLKDLGVLKQLPIAGRLYVDLENPLK